MKITPMAQGTGAPGVDLGAVSLGRTSPDRIAAAKAIAAGETPIRNESADRQSQRIEETMRKISMKTNFSPDRAFEESIQPEPLTESTPSGTIEPESTQSADVTKPLSPQFAALAKQRRSLQVKERELVEKEKALQQREASGGSSDVLGRLKANPLSVLSEAGVTYDQLTEAILHGGSAANPEVQALKDEIKALKEGVDKNFSQRDVQAEESALTEMLYEAEEYAKDGDNYQLIRDTDAYDQVLRRIHTHYKKTGRVLDVRSVMDTLENELIERHLKYASHPKIQPRLPTAPVNQVQPRQPQQGLRTLTNQDTARPQLGRRERAIAAALGRLK